MGKKHRQRNAQSLRGRLEQFLAKGDTRGAVDAAKQLVREQPGAASEELAVRAYTARIRELIDEGLGREAAALASIVRERFPAQASSCGSLLDDARLAGGDFDALFEELRDAPEERRAAVEERLLPWIADPATIARSTLLDPDDALAREARIAGEVFEIVTTRLATAEELAVLGEIRRRSPFASWKLLIRAIDAFHRNEDDRVAANVAAIDARSPAARAGHVLTELMAGRQKAGRNFAAERLSDRITGGRATIAARLRAIESASNDDDRRRLREEVRELAKTFDTLTPYEREQVRKTLLPFCGVHFGPEQVAGMLRIDQSAIPLYGSLLTEKAGSPFAAAAWVVHADLGLERNEIEPWQAAEFYLHALSVGGDVDDEFACHDPTHDHPVDDMPLDTKDVVEKILATRPAPSVLSRLGPYLDRLPPNEETRVLKAWRKADRQAAEPLVRLLRIAEQERRYGDVPALIRDGDRLKIIDPEYARLRLRLSFRRAEELLAARKRGGAAMLLDEIAARPEALGEDESTYLLALQWAAASPEKAGEVLTELAQRGVTAEIILAEVTASLELPFPMPASKPPASEMLEGFRKATGALRSVGSSAKNIAWIVERAAAQMETATAAQLITLGDAAIDHGMFELAWTISSAGVQLPGPSLPRFLLLRAAVLIAGSGDFMGAGDALDASATLARLANDHDAVARAVRIGDVFALGVNAHLEEDEVESIVDVERNRRMPRQMSRPPKKPRQRKSQPKKERGLFDE